MAETKSATTKPLEPEEVIVTVSKGHAKHVKIVEQDSPANAEITVKVSRRRTGASVPLLGLMVK
jgi:hypothetical protein